MANLPTLSTTTLAASDINLTVDLNEKPLQQVNGTIEKLNSNLSLFTRELNNTLSSLTTQFEKNNKLLSENNKIIKEDSVENLSKNLVSSNKDVLEKLNLNLNETFKSFNNTINTSYKKERSQSLFNLTPKQIAKDTLGSVKDMAMDKIMNNPVIKGFANFKNAIGALSGGGANKDSRKEKTQEQIELDNEKIKREERTNELLEDILKALLNKKTNDDKKDVKKSILQKITTEGTTGSPILDNLLGVGGGLALLEIIRNFGKRILGSIKSTFSGIFAGLSKLVPESVKTGIKQLAPTIFGKLGGSLLPKILGGSISLAIDGFLGYMEDWEASEGSKIAGAILGGTGDRYLGALTNATKWGMLGFLAGGPPGLVFGALLGAGLGAFGGENIAKLMDAAIQKSGSFFTDAGNWIGEQWEDLITNIKNTWKENVTEPLDKLIDNFPSFDSIFDSLSQSIDDIKNYFSNLIDSLNPFSSNEETPKPPPPPSLSLGKSSEGTSVFNPKLTDTFETGVSQESTDVSKYMPGLPSAAPVVETTLPPLFKNMYEESVEKDVPLNNNPLANEETRRNALGIQAGENIPQTLTPIKKLIPGLESYEGTEQTNKTESLLDKVTGTLRDFFGLNNDIKSKKIAIDLIAKEEDSRLANGTKKVSEVMIDPNGVDRTIGYGFKYIDNKLVSDIEKAKDGEYTMSKVEADNILSTKVNDFHNGLSKLDDKVDGVSIGEIFKEVKNPNRKAVLISLAYQMGLEKITTFKNMWKNINEANKLSNSIFPSNEGKYWGLAGEHIIKNAAMTGPSDLQKQLQGYQISDEKVETRADRARNIMKTGEIEAKDGYVSYKPTRLLTGEYPGARYNPELTVPLNVIKDEMSDVTKKIMSNVNSYYERNDSIKEIALENRVVKMIEKTAEMQNRLKQKESMETSRMKMNVPIVNNVVDNKQVTNNNQSLLMSTSSRNPHNVFRLS